MAINFVINSFIISKAQWKTKKFKLVLTVVGFLLPLFKGEAVIWNIIIRKASFLFLAKKGPCVLDFMGFLCVVLFKIRQRTDVTILGSLSSFDCVKMYCLRSWTLLFWLFLSQKWVTADYSVLIKSLLRCILTSFKRSLNQMKKQSKSKSCNCNRNSSVDAGAAGWHLWFPLCRRSDVNITWSLWISAFLGDTLLPPCD